MTNADRQWLWTQVSLCRSGARIARKYEKLSRHSKAYYHAEAVALDAKRKTLEARLKESEAQ